MITKTLNLDSAYQDLFAEILKKSTAAHAEDPSVRIIDISNIESFFGSIEEIAALDPKFLRLPLDEPIFEIDSDTRKISVPNEFKANGLSVQNDHLAEIIFFRIDRYFDDMDLGNCNIEINWKMGNKSGKTSRFVMAKDIQPGYIIFGWPIDKEITEKSGAVNFAIEFNKKDNEGKITYCFNTMPITVNVKEGLVLEEEVEIANLDNAVLGILTNSSFGEGDAAVGEIQWLTGDGEGLVTGGGPRSFSPNDFQDTINLHTDIRAGVPSSRSVDLFAQAYVDAGTDIRYTDANNNTIMAEMIQVSQMQVPADRENLVEGNVYYVGTGPSSHVANADELVDESVNLFQIKPLNENLIYFVKVSDDPEAYEQASEEQLATWGTENPVNLYVKIARITVDEAGNYLIKAQGQKFDNNGIKIGSGDVKATAVVTIPQPVQPEKINIEMSQPENLDEGYSFDEDMENVLYLDASGNGTLTASAEIEEFGALQFLWQKKNGNEFANISDDVPFKDLNSDTFAVNEVGIYKVRVVNFQNAEATAPISSAEIIASPLAGKITSALVKGAVGNGNPVIVPSTGLSYNSTGRLAINSVTISVNENDIIVDGQKGTFEFEWYKEELNEDAEVSWTKIEGATSNQYKITSGDGTFRPVVKNNYNGSIYTFVLDSVVVNDNAT